MLHYMGIIFKKETLNKINCFLAIQFPMMPFKSNYCFEKDYEDI